jgi:hypothetical protein
MDNNVFSKEWWSNAINEILVDESLSLNDFSEKDKKIIQNMYSIEDIQRFLWIIKGFKLNRHEDGFGIAFKTQTGTASPELAEKMNKWISKKFPGSGIIVKYEPTYKDIGFLYRKNIKEIQLGREPSPYQEYIRDNEDKIEAAAAHFNYPIPDLQYAFFLGKEVVLSDDIWSKLENSDSYKTKSLEDVIKKANELKINIKPYIDAIKNDTELPFPLVFNYMPNKYYLVGGDVVLSLYKALNVIPVALMATLDLQDKKDISKKEYELKELEDQIEVDTVKTKDERIDILSNFLKFAVKFLNLSNLPKGLTLSYDTKQAKHRHTFGYFNPENDKIWLYVKDRNTADILRTLAHELIHLKQAEEGRIDHTSGDTGSPIENEANAMAGVLLRNFGVNHEEIYEGLNK